MRRSGSPGRGGGISATIAGPLATRRFPLGIAPLPVPIGVELHQQAISLSHRADMLIAGQRRRLQTHARSLKDRERADLSWRRGLDLVRPQGRLRKRRSIVEQGQEATGRGAFNRDGFQDRPDRLAGGKFQRLHRISRNR